jgi:hypothetical protein
MEDSRSPTSEQREASRRAANGLFVGQEKRASVAKQELEAENAANDAKTARLRALRLEKEKTERDAEASAKGLPSRSG